MFINKESIDAVYFSDMTDIRKLASFEKDRNKIIMASNLDVDYRMSLLKHIEFYEHKLVKLFMQD